MWDYLLVLFSALMVPLWIGACVSSRRQSRGTRQLVFLLGTFVCCPALSSTLFGTMAELAIGKIEEPVGSGVLAIFVFAVVMSFMLWFLGFWIASVFG